MPTETTAPGTRAGRSAGIASGPSRTDAIRILHVTFSMATGGTERVVRRLIDGLDHDKFEHLVCTIGGDAHDDQIAIHAIPALQRKFPSHVPEIMRVMRSFQPHVVHSRNWAGVEAILAARVCNVPTVIHSEHGRDISNMDRLPYRQKWLRRMYFPMATRLFAVSQELRQFYRAQVGWPARNMFVMPNGVDTAAFRPSTQSRKRMRETLKLSDSTLVVGTVSRLNPVKDHRTLLRAMSQLLRDGIDAATIIVGDGSEMPGLRDFVAEDPALQQRTMFVGEMADVQEWLNALDVFVLPSKSEGMSNTLLEAMSAGIAPIASAVGGNLEVIENEVSGLLFPVGDAQDLSRKIMAMIPAENRRRFSESARRRVEDQFSIQKMLRRYDALYSGSEAEA